jgi:hypothetical protein
VTWHSIGSFADTRFTHRYTPSIPFGTGPRLAPIGPQHSVQPAREFNNVSDKRGGGGVGLSTVCVSFGRIGRSGRQLSHVADETAAQGFVRAGLRRRQTSVMRVRWACRLIEASPAATPLLELTGVPVGHSGAPSGRERPGAMKASDGSPSLVGGTAECQAYRCARGRGDGLTRSGRDRLRHFK